MMKKIIKKMLRRKQVMKTWIWKLMIRKQETEVTEEDEVNDENQNEPELEESE